MDNTQQPTPSEEVNATANEENGQDMAQALEEFERDMKPIAKDDFLTGKVIRVDNDGIYVDVGYKTDGFVPANQVSNAPDVSPMDLVKVGDEINVVVQRVDESEGNLLLSKRRADNEAAWRRITEAKDKNTTLVAAIFDNEETGSGTKQGAHSPVLGNMLLRLVMALGGDFEDFGRAVHRTFMVSADNAHAFHPNYPEKYDPTNHPSLGGGPCIKVNANCKYMSDAHSAAIFKSLCEKAEAPFQYFVNHSDVAGGSTLGNILTGQLDIEGVDVGNPVLAMHSVRETGSCDDHVNMIKVMKQFFS
jgi:aspartyl aminopeptidase